MNRGDARLYLDNLNFLACGLASGPDSERQAADCSPAETDKNGIFAISGKMAVGGRFASFTRQPAASTTVFASTGNTLTDSGSGFIASGFGAGMTLIVEGTGGNGYRAAAQSR